MTDAGILGEISLAFGVYEFERLEDGERVFLLPGDDQVLVYQEKEDFAGG